MKVRCLFGGAVLCAASATLSAQVNVTTYHNDVSRTGQNTQETILTPANVNSSQFGKLFALTLDGAIYAQPLYLSGVNIAGGQHNVLYVATEHDSVYAIDADSGTVYAHASLIPAGGTTVNSNADLACGDIQPEIGISGTPVIDPVGGTLYVMAKSKVNGAFYQYLHALDVSTLAEKLNGPVSIQAKVVGTGYDASGGYVTFNPLRQNQRPALLLENGHVVIGWSSHCDNDPYHGWVMSYNAQTLAQEAVLNDTPDGNRGGVWMGGSGPAADAAGHIYLATGNGTWNGTTDFGDSDLKLGPPSNGAFPLLDYFTPFDQATLANDDDDLGAAGPVLLPALASGLYFSQQGKEGTIYLLNTANLGKYCVDLTPACTNSDPNVAQEILGANPGVWGAPAYWNGNLYWAAVNDNIRAYSFNAGGSGKISSAPTSESAQIFAFAAPTPSISANGTTNGILWALDGPGDDLGCDAGTNCLGLYAYDATNLSHLLYTSAQAANGRDSTGTTTKFQAPMIANGKVYIGTETAVIAYGLLEGALPVAASPVLSPPPGQYGSAQTVTLSDATSGASIYYTTNATVPGTGSTKYTAPFTVSTSETVQAIAVAGGYQASAVAGGAYLIGGTGTTGVNLAPVDDNDAISNNGSAPANGGFDHGGHSYSSNLLGTSITWNGNVYNFGAAGTADAAAWTTIPLPAGNYNTLSLLGAAANGNQPNQTFVVTYTDGTTSTFVQGLSDWFTSHLYPGESLVKTMAYRVGSGGAQQAGPVYLYGYSFTLNSAKTVKSLTLPNNANVVILAVDVLGASSGSVNYSSGFSSGAGLNLLGVTVTNNTLQLTDGGTYEANAVWTAAPLNVQSFTTDFTFHITPAGAGTADGFTFVIQNTGAGARGILGGGLGSQGIGSSVAVKFDLYSNNGEGTDSTGFYVGGASPTIPAIDMTASGVNLHSGDTLHAHLAYDGTTLTLTLTDTVTGASFTTAKAINIPVTVGGSTAYVGFTAGTGGATAVQQIATWTYTSGAPAAAVNDPAGFSSGAGFNLLGVTVTNTTLQLTDGGTYEANAVWTASPLNVQRFSTDFTFLETAASADGFAFVIQNAGAGARGSLGGGLGYQGIGSSVAVKFDLYNNSGEGTDSTGFYVDGAYPETPALDMTSSGVNLHNPDPLHAHLSYDGTTLTLTLTDTTTGASFSASQAINIPATVGGNTAYVGFTAGTGGATAVQQILNWTYLVN